MRQVIFLVLCCFIFGASAKYVRLTNNDYAQEGEFPYQVLLMQDGRFLCGGSLVSNFHVVTAAHCVYKWVQERIDMNRINVVVGTINLSAGTPVPVARLAYHNQYTYPAVNFDIAVITLAEAVQESDTVKIIPLPQPFSKYPIDSRLTVTGFGNDHLNGPTSQYLKKMEMHVVDQDTCQKYWDQMEILPSTICATLAPGYGVCQGDSGGPLTINGGVLIGVVSATSVVGCGSGIPDLFTNVAYCMDFIQSEMNLK